MTDIKETGLKGLRSGEGTLDNNASKLNFDELISNIHSMQRASTGLLHLMFKPTYSEPIGLKLASAGYGESVYDENAVSDWDLNNLNEVRAVNQPGILQLGNGILKMGTTGITTFLDGTVGFLYGLGTGTFNALGANGENEDGSKKTFIQGLWDNDFNRAMSDILDTMEEVAPNYYSQAELDSPWYTNILSANFIGDKLLKNMGFTIGALAAMYATGGTGIAGGIGKGALTAAKFTVGGMGKALGASRGTLAGINSFARGTGLLAHHLVLTAIGASGEASIEAVNAVKEGAKDAYRNLDIRRLELIDSLDPEAPDYYENLNVINAATELYKEDIDSKFRDAGNSVYLANMAILSVSNALEFAPIIKGGFQRSAKLSDFERRLGERTVGALEWALGILRGELASIANTVDKSWGRALKKSAFNALVEGSEEASQNLASNSNLLQAKAKLNNDANDTILGYRINPEATEELVDYTKSFSKALYDNFGKPESKGWEEFFLGAITGGIGFIGLRPRNVKNEEGLQMYDPITHKKITTWKPKGLSDWFQGGIIGAKRDIDELYDLNQIIVDAVNQKLADPDFIKRTLHAIASKAIAKEMDEALQQNDMFKFKNSEIGKLVEDVFFFRDKGMIDEYKNIYQGMTNIDDKTLLQLYTATADPEGNTELALEDMQSVREEYLGKARRNLEKIKMIQDYYDYVDQEYRDRSPLFKEELAYQYVRLDDTRRRIQELEEKNEKPNKLKAALLGIADKAENLVGATDTPYSFKKAYEELFLGLTESEQKDLDRLKRQEKVYKHRIDKIRNNPDMVDLLHNIAFMNAKMEHDSKDIDSLTQRLKDASSISEINLIIAGADTTVKLEIINKAYQEGDDELKTKLKAQVSASTAYTESIKRLNKLYNKEDAKELNLAMTNLLYNVYMGNNMDLNEVKNSLTQIHDELLEDSISTIALLMPDSYGIFESFLGEENKLDKEIFLDVLEGTIEDVGNGIINGERFKVLQESRARVKKQQEEAEKKKQLQELKAQQRPAKSYEEALNNSTYVKLYSNLEAYRDEIESFGVDKLDNIIKTAIGDSEHKDNPKQIKNALNFAIRVLSSDNHLGIIKELRGKTGANADLNILLDLLEETYKKGSAPKSTTPPAFKEILKQLKDADKKKDANKVLTLAALVSKNIDQYLQQGAKTKDLDYIAELEKKYKKSNTASSEDNKEHQDGELSTEVTEKNGVKTTKFTWWKKNKLNKVVPTIGGGLSISTDDIDESFIEEDIKDMEKVVLTELREGSDGTSFAGTIRYSIKGEKGRKTTDVKFKRNPTNKEEVKKEEIKVEPEEKETPVLAKDSYTQSLLNKFYSSKHIDLTSLSTELQLLILSDLERTINLIKSNREIPTELQAYADIILANNPQNSSPISEVEGKNTFPEANATNDDELNGAFRGLYEVGSTITGTPNLLLQMRAEKASKESLEANYGTVQHAELVLWCIDNILKDIKESLIPIKVIAIVGESYANGQPNITLYTAVKANAKVGAKKNKTVKDIAKNRWLQETNDGEYIIIGTLGYNKNNLEQLKLWSSIREDIDNQIAASGITEGYFVSSNEKHTFKINNIGEGRPALTHYLHSSTSSIVELIEGADKERNPHNYTLKDLKWQIIYTDEPKGVHVNSSKDKIKGNAELLPGKVYVLIPTPNGSYYRHPVNPITIDEINKDSSLYKKIDSLIETIIKNKNVKDVISLKGQLVLEKEAEDLSFLDIYFNDDGIRVQYVPREGVKTSVILNADEGAAIDLLKDIIYNRIRPFISVTLGHLSSPNSIRMLNDAGALQLKRGLAMFSYVGANYTVIPYNNSTNSKQGPRVRSSLESQGQELRYNGTLIFKIGNDYYKNGKIITDANEIQELNDLSAIKDGLYIGESLWKWKKVKGKYILNPMAGLYYFVQKGNYLAVYHEDSSGNITKVPRTKINSILDARKRVLEFKSTLEFNRRMQGIQSGEAEAGETLDTGIGEEEGGTLEEKEITPDTVLDFIQINNTNMGFSRIFPLNDWNKKDQDIRMEPDGWGAKNGLTYYKKSFNDGRKGDNVTIWFKDEPSLEIRQQIELFLEKGKRLDDTETLAKILNGDIVFTEAKKDKKQETLSGNIEEIEVPTSTGDTRKIKAEKVQYSDLKNGDIIWYSGPETATPITRITVAAIDNGEVYGSSGILPKNRTYYREVTQDFSNTKIDPTIESRKQDAIKRATYDLELLKGLKIGDTIALPSKTQPNYKATIASIEFSETDDLLDAYSYSDITGTVVITYVDNGDGFTYTEPVSNILANPEYKKINKQSQKPLIDLDNSGNNSTFVEKLLDSREDTTELEDILYEKAATIASEKGITFDEDCSKTELIAWYKDNVGFDLNSIPSNADMSTVKDIIENCK